MSFDSFEYKTTSGYADSVKSGAINLDEAQGIVECFVAGIGNKDSVGDIVVSGAFTKSLMRRKPRVVWGHNWNDPIGKVLEIYEVGPNDRRLPLKMKMAGIGGLFAKVQFNLHSDKGREAFANVAFFGEEQEWSIGYKTLRAQYDQKSQANMIYELELYEVSPVLHGANQLTGTISVKADDPYGTGIIEAPAGPPAPQQRNMTEMVKMMEQQLTEMFGAKVSVVEMDDENITYAKMGTGGAIQKFKCPYMHDGTRFMFGAPKPIPVAIVQPPMPGAVPMGGVPANEPRRIVRPQQMPSIPVAIKPGMSGMVMVPLPPVQYENSQPTAEIDKNNLDKEEADLRDALLKIVKRHGRFNEDADGVWAGYKPAAENYVAKIGVKCANCVFYKGGSNCEIIAMPVEPEGKCRFAVIPKGVVLGDTSMKKQYEMDSEQDEDSYVDQLEVKYPGELAVAALRGVVGRRRKKRRKYKLLSEFGSEVDQEEKAYVIPVLPEQAFRVKQLLDPIFDYHRAESFVDVDGIVISSGVSFELIEAVDTALENTKKKDDLKGLESKSIGYRIGRSIGSRLVDRPSIGRDKDRKRRGIGANRADMPTGGIAGSRKPTGSNFDPDRDGWVDEGTTRPRFVGVPGDKPEQPGRASGGRQDEETDFIRMPQRGKPDEITPPIGIATQEDSEQLARPMPNIRPKTSLRDRLANRDANRHGIPGENPERLDPLEKENRSRHEEMARNWLESGLGWMDAPRNENDRRHSPDYLRGQELASNHARISWGGANAGRRKIGGAPRKPSNIEDDIKDSKDYVDWYMGHIARMGALNDRVRNRRNEDNRRRMSDDEIRGFTEAIREEVASRLPEGARIDSNEARDIKRWMSMHGFGEGLASGEQRSIDELFDAYGKPSFRDRRVPDPYGDDFDPDNPMDQDGQVFEETDIDLYERLIDAFLEPETPARQQVQRLPREEPVREPEQIQVPRPRPEPEFDPDNPFGEDNEPIASETRDTYDELIDRMFGPGASRGLSSGQIENRRKYAEYLNTTPKRRKDKDIRDFQGAAFYGLSSGGKNTVPPEGTRLDAEDPRVQKMFDAMADQIVEAMEEALATNDPAKWKKPWISVGGIRNPYTGESYQGMHNQMLLGFVSSARGYKTGRWAGRTQWRRWARAKYGVDIDQIDESRGVDVLIPIRDKKTGKITGFVEEKVYNIDEIKGLPPEAYLPVKVNKEEASMLLQEIANETGAVLTTNEDEAFYSPDGDFISMPPREQFKDNLGYYSTLFHELTHWTGHKSRNDRHEFITNPKPGSPISNSEGYAFEELVAEIGSSIAMSFLGVETEIDENHLEYLKFWIGRLKNDKGKLRDAFRQAEEAIDYFLWSSSTFRDVLGVNEAQAEARRERFYARRVKPDVDLAPGDSIEAPSGVIYPDDIADAPGLSSGRKKGISRFAGLSAEEKRIYDPFGKTQRTPDGRHYDVLNGLSSGKEADPILSVDRGDGKPRVSITPTPSGPGSASYRELFDLPFDPTPEQTRIVDTVLAHMLGTVPPGIISVKAGAGTSKTTTQKIAMAAAQRFADIDHLLNNPERLAQKLDHVQDFFGPVAEKILSDSGFAGKRLSELPEADRAKAIEALRNYVTSRRSYYTVFSRQMREEVQGEFTPNTGVATLSQLAYWSLRMGSADQKYGKGMGRKIQISQQRRRPLRDIVKDGKVVVEGKDRTVTVKDAEGKDTTYTGFKPNWRDRGYVMVSDGKSMGQYVGLYDEKTPAWGKISEKGPNKGKIVFPYTSPSGITTELTQGQMGDALFNALRRFLTSADTEISEKHFVPTEMEMDRINTARISGRTLYAGDRSFPNPPKEWVESVKRAWADISKGDSKVLPTQDQIMKLWVGSDPDLRVDRGMLAHNIVRNENLSLSKDSKLAGRINEHLKGLYGVDDQGNIRLPDPSEVKEELSDFLSGEILADGDLDYSVTKGRRSVPGISGMAIKNVSILSRADGKFTIRLGLAPQFGGEQEVPLSMFMIDEAQDMNEAMMNVITANRDRLPIFLVGDSRQQIMGWRGSMDILSGSDPDFVLPLREAFRYGDVLQHVSNILQMRGNRRDQQMTGVNPGEYVQGAAHKVMEKLFNFRDMSVDDIAKRLSTIQARHGRDLIRLSRDKDTRYSGPVSAIPKDDRGVPDLNALASELRSLEGDPSGVARRKEIMKALADLGDVMVEDARGLMKERGKLYEFEAILTSTNTGIFEAALAVSESRRIDGVGGAKTLNITVPARKYDEFLDFFRHFAWAINQGDNGKIPRPKQSDLIGDHWTPESIVAAAQSRSSNPGLATAVGLLVNGIQVDPNDPNSRVVLAPWEWLRLMGATPGDIDPKEAQDVNVKILRARETLALPGTITHPNPGKRDNQTKVTGKDLIAMGTAEFKGGVKGAGGDTAIGTRGEFLDIIPDDETNQFKRVLWQLQLDPMRKEEWTGGVVVTGHGVQKPDPKKRAASMGSPGIYYRDMVDIVSQLVKEGLVEKDEIQARPDVWRQTAAAKAGSYEPGWLITGKIKGIDKPWSQMTPAEREKVSDRTARVLTMVGERMRESASRQHGDIEIQTIDTAKGREWNSVRIWDDYFPAQQPFDYAKLTPERKNEVIDDLVSTLLPEDGPAGTTVKRRWTATLQWMPAGTTINELKKQFKKDPQEVRNLVRDAIKKDFDIDPPKVGEQTAREGLNKAYVGTSRAKRILDVGPVFSIDMLRGEVAKDEAELARLIKEGVIPEAAGKPDGWKIPYARAFRDPEGRIIDAALAGEDDEETTRREPGKYVSEDEKYSVDEIDAEDAASLFKPDPNPQKTYDQHRGDVGEAGLSSGLNNGPFRPLRRDIRDTVDSTVESLSSGGNVDREQVDAAIKEIGRRMRDAIIAREKQKILTRDERDGQMQQLVEMGILDELDMHDVWYEEILAEATPEERDYLMTGKPVDMSQDEWDQLMSDAMDAEAEFMRETVEADTILSNATWASDTLSSRTASSEEKAVARQMLSSENGLSSGRSERRVTKTIKQVRDEMPYDYAAAGSRFPPSKEQRDVIDAVMTGENVVVMALAGTGKTSTLELTARRLRDQQPDKKILYLVFNRKNREEAELRFAEYPNVEVRTIDSVAYSAIISADPRGAGKKFNAQKDRQDDFISPNQYSRLARHYGVSEDIARAAALEVKGWSNSADEKSTPQGAIRRSQKELTASEAKEVSDLANRIFADMFDPESPVAISQNAILKKFVLTNPDLSTGKAMKRNTSGNDILFFDEAQDSNPAITKMVSGQTMQTVLVGDSNQAIYAFRGSVDEIDKFDAKYRLTLTESYRFNPVIAGFANRQLSAHQRFLDSEGTPTRGSTYRLKGAGPDGAILESEEDLPEGFMSRTNRPLKKDGTHETLAILTNTNAEAFNRAIEQINAGRTVGVVSVFKDDLTAMIDHLEWLRGGKSGKRKGTFDALLEFESWAALERAAGETSGTFNPRADKTKVSSRNQQAITAYRLAKEMEFNFGKMRGYVDRLVVTDGKPATKPVDEDKLDTLEFSKGQKIEIVPGLASLTVEDGELQIQTTFIKDTKDPKYAQVQAIRAELKKLGFSDQPRGPKGGKRLVTPSASPDESRRIAKDIVKILGGSSEEKPTDGGVDFSSPSTYSGLTGSGVSLSDVGGIGTGITARISPTKNGDGKILIQLGGNTFTHKTTIGKSGVGLSFNRGGMTPQGHDPSTWAVVADSPEDAAQKMMGLRKAFGTTTAQNSAPTSKPDAGQAPDTKAVDLYVQTAHRSKGLEFDTVIAGKDFTDGRATDLEENVIYDEETGLASLDPSKIDPEELRLQYVTATRAMKRLVTGGLGWITDITTDEDEQYRPVQGLESGGTAGRRVGKATRRIAGNTPNVIDRPARSRVGEGRDGRTTGGRAARAGDSLSSGARLNPQSMDATFGSRLALIGREQMPEDFIRGLSPDRRALWSEIYTPENIQSAMNFWNGLSNNGISVVMESSPRNAKSQSAPRVAAFKRIGASMKKDGPVTIGSTTNNNPATATPETWMLPVSKLREMIRIPTEFGEAKTDEFGKVEKEARPIQTEMISASDLAVLLGLDPADAAQLERPDAGITQDSVRRLIATMGRHPEFTAFRFFAPPAPGTFSDWARALFDSNGRADMRERFIISAFGKDAYPYWWDPYEEKIISQDEYADLGLDGETIKFFSTGSFSSSRRDPGYTEVQDNLVIGSMEGGLGYEALAGDLRGMQAKPRSVAVGQPEPAEFPLEKLMDYLGIPNNSEGYGELAKRIADQFGVEIADAGLGTPGEWRSINRWKKTGINPGVIGEMIRTGLIPDADSVWGASGLDSKILKKKSNVFESFIDFAKQNHPDLKTSEIYELMPDGKNAPRFIKPVAEKKGRTWQAMNPSDVYVDETGMQSLVNRLNEKLGTNYTIDDIFSDERLRAARDLHKEGKTSINGDKLDVKPVERKPQAPAATSREPDLPEPEDTEVETPQPRSIREQLEEMPEPTNDDLGLPQNPNTEEESEETDWEEVLSRPRGSRRLPGEAATAEDLFPEDPEDEDNFDEASRSRRPEYDDMEEFE